MNFKLLIPPIIEILYRKTQGVFRRNYVIGQYSLDIPPHIDLPRHQKLHKLYDRFLPVLAKHISGSKLIIDVGANIGDTPIAILQKCQNPMLCIEPSDVFYSYLKKNLEALSPQDASRVKTIKKMVGTGSIAGTLDHSNARKGTASVRIETDSNLVTHAPLDTLVDNHGEVILLKVDTDGFDFDVIQSAERILSQSEPILFWENEIAEDFQFEGFSQLYKMLEKNGYSHIFIFDNYGNLITEESNFSTLKNINSYLYSMEKNGQSRTFYYTDVLASTDKNFDKVKMAIEEYKNEWINK
jgi:FkbM family methyltransferase